MLHLLQRSNRVGVRCGLGRLAAAVTAEGTPGLLPAVPAAPSLSKLPRPQRQQYRHKQWSVEHERT